MTTVLCVAGAFYLGSQLSVLHGFAFGVMGMGFTYLTLVCIAVGFATFRAIR